MNQDSVFEYLVFGHKMKAMQIPTSLAHEGWEKNCQEKQHPSYI